MSNEFYFRGVESTRDIKDVTSFLAAQDLGYPRYDEWVQRTEHEIFSGYKKAVLCFSERTLVADVICQPHKASQYLLEIKNVRVHSQVRDRLVGSFALRQAEKEFGRGFLGAVCDAPAYRRDIITFLASNDYAPVATLPLYDSTQPDVCFIKLFNQKSRDHMMKHANNLFISQSQ